jgi:hypothetical protein
MGWADQHGTLFASSGIPRTEGSKSTKMERGTYLPLPVSVKKVSKEPPSERSVASGLGRPSARRPCSRRYLAGCVSVGRMVAASIRTAPKRSYPIARPPGRCLSLLVFWVHDEGVANVRMVGKGSQMQGSIAILNCLKFWARHNVPLLA